MRNLRYHLSALALVCLPLAAAAQQSQQPLSNIQYLTRCRALSRAEKSAATSGDLQGALNIVLHEMMPLEPGDMALNLDAARISFEIGDLRATKYYLGRFTAWQQHLRNDPAAGQLKVFVALVDGVSSDENPRSSKLPGSISRRMALELECGQDIGSGYFRTARLVLNEMGRTHCNPFTINILSRKLAHAIEVQRVGAGKASP